MRNDPDPEIDKARIRNKITTACLHAVAPVNQVIDWRPIPQQSGPEKRLDCRSQGRIPNGTDNSHRHVAERRISTIASFFTFVGMFRGINFHVG